MPTMMGRGFGWLRDKFDARDYRYIPRIPPRLVPSSIDLRKYDSPISDQGNLGSCTAHAGTGIQEFIMLLQGMSVAECSELFLYYNTRVIQGTVSYDSGASIRDTMKSMVQDGAAHEHDWPYDISKFKIKPPAICYTDGKLNIVTKYEKLTQTIAMMKSCLAEGFPFMFGFDVYESFRNIGIDGIMPYPDTAKEDVLGGHAVMAVGYDDLVQRMIVRNSWGVGWGDKGYFYMPYKVLSNTSMSADYWVARAVSGVAPPPPPPAPTPSPSPSPPPPPPVPDDLTSRVIALENDVAILKQKMVNISKASA